MSKAKIILSLVLFLSIFSNGASQDRKLEIGIEPIYTYLVPNGDDPFLESYSDDIYGLGLVFEKPILKANDKLIVSSGLYYYYFTSYSHRRFYIDLPSCEVGETEIRYQLDFKGEQHSHNVRVPVKINYNLKDFLISGGVLIDYEISHKTFLDYTTTPNRSCDEEPEPINFEKRKLNFRLHVGLGYTVNIGHKTRLVPEVSYNLFFNEFKNNDYIKYDAINFHGLGIGCKVFF